MGVKPARLIFRWCRFAGVPASGAFRHALSQKLAMKGFLARGVKHYKTQCAMHLLGPMLGARYGVGKTVCGGSLLGDNAALAVEIVDRKHGAWPPCFPLSL
jgi:hypothetical protein